MLLHLRKGILEKTITEMMKLPNTQVSLFKGALLISRWGQIETEKNMKSREVYRILEGITKRVKEIVQMNFGSAEKITDFSIVEIINHVLYNDLGFIVDECDYGPLGNFFIEKVTFIQTVQPQICFEILNACTGSLIQKRSFNYDEYNYA